MENKMKTFDAALEFIQTGTAQVDATPSKVIEIGTGFVDADLVLTIATSTGTNSVNVQFSDTADFSTVIAGPKQEIPTSFSGVMILPFRNLLAANHSHGYMRLSPTVGGALTMGAYAAKK